MALCAEIPVVFCLILPKQRMEKLMIVRLWSSGIIQSVVANILWGTTFISTQKLLTYLPPSTLSLIRFALASTALFLISPFLGHKIKRPDFGSKTLWITATGLLGFGFLYPLQNFALIKISTSLSAIIMLTSPLIVAAITMFKDRSIAKNKVVGILISTVGSLVIVSASKSLNLEDSQHLMLGMLLMFLASLCLAMSNFTAKKSLSEVDQVNLTFWAMIVGAVFLLPFSIVERPSFDQTLLRSDIVVNILYLAIICSVIAFFLWNDALAKADPATISSTMHIKTPVAVAIGCLINQEPVSMPLLGGALLVVSGVFFTNRPQPINRDIR
jgi:drug/metabolite transporter (DMT)-like permease